MAFAGTVKKAVGSGFRHARVFELDDDDLPLVSESSGTAATGYKVTGAKALAGNFPDPQIIHHTGEDRVIATALLPPTEGVTFEMRSGITNLELDAMVTGVEVYQLGDMQTMAVQTDRQGCEADVCVLAYRAAQDADPTSTSKGARRWIWVLLPKATIFPMRSAMEEGGMDENAYTVVPHQVASWPWGKALSNEDEGAEETQIIYGVSEGEPVMDVWLGDDARVEFTLSETAREKYDGDAEDDVAKVRVFTFSKNDGTFTDVTDSVTISTTAITFGAAPEADDVIIAFYEKAGC